MKKTGYYKRKKIFFYTGGLVLLFSSCLSVQSQDRPLIWVIPSEQQAIFEKIEKQAWAKSVYSGFIEELIQVIDLHHSDPIVVCKIGEAWENPFVVVFELFNGNENNKLN